MEQEGEAGGSMTLVTRLVVAPNLSSDTHQAWPPVSKADPHSLALVLTSLVPLV